MKIVTENPYASITAFIGIFIGILQMFVPMDFLTKEMQVNINLALYPVIVFLMGRWTRISTDQAKVLNQIDDNKNQIK